MNTWFLYFALTLAVEVPIVVAIGPKVRRRSVAVDAVLANAMTHPLAWIAVGSGFNWWLVEALVTLVETVVYGTVTRMRWPRAALASCVANGATIALSFVV